MEYKLSSNIDYEHVIVLIDAEILNQYLISYHEEDELSYIKSQCKDEPKSSWVSEGDIMNVFSVPIIRINDENDIVIVDGRHRVYWMMSKNMLEIPVAISHFTKKALDERGLFLKMVDILNMPCKVIPKPRTAVSSIDMNAIFKKFIKRPFK
ncbi:hypothetical protein [Aeromonas hydrophila]|uniref:hypothetical protein n=1 Tax=Aeromonas hydrophila TaxID=644 RepID=UPI002B49A1A6|nr:hypothetical protein [Aeromonas hydrophila]